MFCMQRLRRLQQSSLTAIRFCFPCTVEKPVSEKLELDVCNTVVVKDHFHFFYSSLLEGMFQISMPDSNAFKPGSGRSFYPIFEIKATYFTDTWEYSCGCPI